LLSFGIYHRQNETQSRKSTHVKAVRVHSTVSHGRLINRFVEVWPWPSLFFHRGSYNNNSQETFRWHLVYTNVLYDSYPLHQCGSILVIQLTTDVFVELPEDGPVRTETCSSHWNKPIVEKLPWVV
jgi:hypothetical protein